ncbi:MAG: hypothetical protein J6S80_01810 [Alphaproteobacteria bacterium]|nr:hypothetical protein [Alphaproteobacteria bacterium]
MRGHLLGKIIRSHIRPYKHYSVDGRLVGKYVIHMPRLFDIPVPYAQGFNIEFTPLVGTKVEDSVRESIKISDAYQMDVWMNWYNIPINVPYKTENNEQAIRAIVDAYLERFNQRAKRSRCVGG